MFQLIFVIALFTSSESFAQKNSPIQKPADPSSIYQKCSNYLQCAFEIAVERAQYWKSEMTRLSGLGAGFKPSDFDRANFYFQYFDWMRKNREELLRLERGLLEINEQIRAKVSAVRDTVLEVNAVEGQDRSVYPIEFNKVVTYLKNLNERMAGKTEVEIKSLLRIQENYLSNSLQVAHSQIMKAIELVNAGINVGLRENSSGFSVHLIQDKNRFDYILRYQGQVLGSAMNVEVSLLNPLEMSSLGMSEAEKWKTITGSSVRLGGYSLDGQVRFRQMQQKLRDVEFRQSNWDPIQNTRSGLPLVTESSFMKAASPVALKSNQIYLLDFCTTDSEELHARFQQESYTMFEVVSEDSLKPVYHFFRAEMRYLGAMGQAPHSGEFNLGVFSREFFNEIKVKLGCESL